MEATSAGTRSSSTSDAAGNETGFFPACSSISKTDGLAEAHTIDFQMHSEVDVGRIRKPRDILKRLSLFLNIFAGSLMFALVVRIFFLVRFMFQSTAYREATIQRSFLSGTVSTGGASGALMDVLVSALAVWTASHARRAADDTLSAEETGICVKRVLLLLSPLFNSFAVGKVFKATGSALFAAVLYPQIIAIFTISLLVGSLFWISGFLLVRVSFARRFGSNIEAFIEMFSAPQDELDGIPAFLKFWLTQVVGRLSPKRRNTPDNKRKDPFKLDLQNTPDFTFTPEGMHILKILHEAMIFAVKATAFSFYASMLVVATFLINNLWTESLPEVVEMIKDLVSMVLVMAGAQYFSHAIRGKHTDMENLFYGFASLEKLFRRLSVMFVSAGVLQLITQLAL